MEKQMSRGRLVGFLVALFLSNIAIMADQAIIPVIANIYEAFPEKLATVNYAVTGSLIVFMISSLVCGKLMQVFSKKNLVLWSFGILCVAEILCGIFVSASYLAVFRTVIAAAMGITNVAAIAMLADTFCDDENKRGTFVGFFNAAMAASGAIMAFVGGFLALNGWTEVFKIFWIGVPILLLMILFLPKTAPNKKVVAEENNLNEKIDLSRFTFFMFMIFIFTLIFMIYQYMMSVYIAEQNLGDSSFSGICASVLTIASAIMCINFGFIYKKLKSATFIPPFVFFALCYLAMFLFPSRATVLICSALIGGSFGTGFSFYYMESTVIVPASKVSTSIAWATAVNAVGMFLTSYFVTWCMSLLKTQSLTATFPIIVGLSVFGIICASYLAIAGKKRNTVELE